MGLLALGAYALAFRTHDEPMILLLGLSALASSAWLFGTINSAFRDGRRALWLIPSSVAALWFPYRLGRLAYSCMALLDCF